MNYYRLFHVSLLYRVFWGIPYQRIMIAMVHVNFFLGSGIIKNRLAECGAGVAEWENLLGDIHFVDQEEDGILIFILGM
jgi:hypothetical protein